MQARRTLAVQANRRRVSDPYAKISPMTVQDRTPPLEVVGECPGVIPDWPALLSLCELLDHHLPSSELPSYRFGGGDRGYGDLLPLAVGRGFDVPARPHVFDVAAMRRWLELSPSAACDTMRATWWMIRRPEDRAEAGQILDHVARGGCASDHRNLPSLDH